MKPTSPPLNRNLSNTSLARIFGVVKAVINFCIKEQGLDCKNPFSGVYLPTENNNKRFLIRQRWQRFFNDWDIVICPQTATTAFPQDEGEYLERKIIVDNIEQDYFQQVFWSGLVTVAHLPSTVFPTGLSQAGLPIGLQAVGAEFNDYITIDFTRLMAQEIGGFIPPPAYA